MEVVIKPGSLVMSDTEIQNYKDYVNTKYPGADKIELLAIGDEVELMVHIPEYKFSRIRRITGYLVGDMSRWNDAKRSEEHDRVKHNI